MCADVRYYTTRVILSSSLRLPGLLVAQMNSYKNASSSPLYIIIIINITQNLPGRLFDITRVIRTPEKLLKYDLFEVFPIISVLRFVSQFVPANHSGKLETGFYSNRLESNKTFHSRRNSFIPLARSKERLL